MTTPPVAEPAPDATAPTPAVPVSAVVAVAVTMVLWASAFVAIRHLGADFRPGSMALGRQLVAVVALGLVVVAGRGLPRPRRQDWPSILVIGVLWFAVYHVALNAAELRVDAGTASMLLQFSPILLTLLAVVFLGERATPGLVVGMLVALAGVLVIGWATSDGDVRGDLVGVLLCLVACGAYAVSVVLQKPLLTRLTALQLTWLATIVGAVATLPFAGQLAADLDVAPAASVWWLVYLGVFPTALAFTTYAVALRHLPASVLGLSTYLVPPLTVVIAWVALAETPPLLAYPGGVLCLLGVWWARRAKS